ncbi:MAG TPA: hypothetical protein VKP61_03505 [Candidatus Acidoferrum sp.]|nr:hypothetical protein [Candidatus Acidoferrum sp.]
MITIRQEQFQALQDDYPAFENRTAVWLKGHFPEDCEMLGENASREQIRYAAQTALHCGFLNRPEISKFIFLSFLLGPNFDLQPEYQWLKTILTNSNAEPRTRMQQALETLAVRLESGTQTLGAPD